MGDVPVRETEVGSVMNNLAKAVECLTQSIEATEARLTGVTRNGGIKNTTSDKPAEPLYNTLLAQNINKIHDKVMNLRFRLDDLLNRVEL